MIFLAYFVDLALAALLIFALMSKKRPRAENAVDERKARFRRILEDPALQAPENFRR